jgi:hypothetical protein
VRYTPNVRLLRRLACPHVVVREVAVGLAVTATVIALVHLPRHETQVHAQATHGVGVHVENIIVPVVDPAT